MKKLFSQAGFTMIELLVVIAVIGVLAVAVLSSINPIEQINKGRDTRARSDAAQLINAVDRYYASLELYPWNVVAAEDGTLTTETQSPEAGVPVAGANCVAADAAGYTVGATTFGNGMCRITAGELWMDELTTTGEVKEAFVNRIQGQTRYSIFVYKAATADATMYACFAPSSGAFQREAIKNCTDNKTSWSAMDSTFAGIVCPNTATYTTATLYTNELICLP